MFFRRQAETYEQMRRRLIRETELGLLIGLRRPDLAPRIPSKEVGTGGFDPQYAEAFWGRILGDTTALLAYARHQESLRAETRYDADGASSPDEEPLR